MAAWYGRGRVRRAYQGLSALRVWVLRALVLVAFIGPLGAGPALASIAAATACAAGCPCDGQEEHDSDMLPCASENASHEAKILVGSEAAALDLACAGAVLRPSSDDAHDRAPDDCVPQCSDCACYVVLALVVGARLMPAEPHGSWVPLAHAHERGQPLGEPTSVFRPPRS